MPKAGISDATFYNWRKKYAGLIPSEMTRLRQLEEENDKPKRIVADLSLDKWEAGQLRFASFTMDRLTGAIFLASESVAVSPNWAEDQLGVNFPEPRERFAVVAGRPGKGTVDRGATVCSCFGVGVRQIAAAVAGGRVTVDAIGRALQAGTNCGSCRSEIQGIIDGHRLQAAE